MASSRPRYRSVLDGLLTHYEYGALDPLREQELLRLLRQHVLRDDDLLRRKAAGTLLLVMDLQRGVVPGFSAPGHGQSGGLPHL